VFKKILVAVDGSSNAIRAAKEAFDLAKLSHAEITLVYVAYFPQFYKTDLADELIESIIEDGKKILTDAREIFKRANFTVKTKLIREAKPSEAICKSAQKYDLIVIGSRGLHKKKEKSIGSVSDAVLHCAPCPVLVVT